MVKVGIGVNVKTIIGDEYTKRMEQLFALNGRTFATFSRRTLGATIHRFLEQTMEERQQSKMGPNGTKWRRVWEVHKKWKDKNRGKSKGDKLTAVDHYNPQPTWTTSDKILGGADDDGITTGSLFRALTGKDPQSKAKISAIGQHFRTTFFKKEDLNGMLQAEFGVKGRINEYVDDFSESGKRPWLADLGMEDIPELDKAIKIRIANYLSNQSTKFHKVFKLIDGGALSFRGKKQQAFSKELSDIFGSVAIAESVKTALRRVRKKYV